jgi:hypothetical protein
MRGAIATDMRVAARSKHTDPNCTRCGKKEDDFYPFFYCKFSHAVWFASPLGLRVDIIKITPKFRTLYPLGHLYRGRKAPRCWLHNWCFKKENQISAFLIKNLKKQQVIFAAPFLFLNMVNIMVTVHKLASYSEVRR